MSLLRSTDVLTEYAAYEYRAVSAIWSAKCRQSFNRLRQGSTFIWVCGGSDYFSNNWLKIGSTQTRHKRLRRDCFPWLEGDDSKWQHLYLNERKCNKVIQLLISRVSVQVRGGSPLFFVAKPFDFYFFFNRLLVWFLTLTVVLTTTFAN